jgi:hypothetical protein
MANTYSKTYDLGTVNREDLSDVITMISPTETPFFSSIRKGTATATLHEWGTDELASATTRTHIEGDDASGWIANDRKRLSNWTQIFTSPFAVTTTQEKVMTAGIKSEMAYQAAKSMKEHKRDIEWTMFNQAAGASGAAGVARTMKPIAVTGAGAFISDGTGGTPDHQSAKATAKLDEADLATAMQAAWDQGGMVDSVFCSGTVKRRISGFTRITGLAATQGQDEMELRTVGPMDKKLVRVIDLYESDFGVVRIIPDRFIATNEGVGTNETKVYILETQHWEIPMLIPTFIEDLAKTGDAMKKWLYSQLTVASKAPPANYLYTGVLNSI